MRCENCEKETFYFRRYSGEKLCKEHFIDSIITKTYRTVSKYKMISHGDRVGVAVSGGKDSLSLLYVMDKLCREKGIELVALTIDEGIEGYRDEAIRNAKYLCDRIGIKHYVLSYKELFDFSLDSIMQEKQRDFSSCSFCGVLRRRAIDLAAGVAKVNVVATAHNLDDFVQTFLMNLMHGDVSRISWMSPYYKDESFPVRRIKPFLELYEEEIALFAYSIGIPFQSVSCPYMHEGLRSEVRDYLNELEARHPGVKYTLFNSCIDIVSRISFERQEIRFCSLCGKPSSNEVCGVCRMKAKVKQNVLNMSNEQQKIGGR